jgi:3-amino-4-hydroxybenzoic acid synthase
VTTAWIDIRGCDSSKIAEFVNAAAEAKIEAVITDGATDTAMGSRREGIQWVTFDAPGHAANGHAGDVSVHDFNGHASELLASRLKLTDREGILVNVDNKERLDEACAAVRAGMLTVIRFKDPTKIPLEIVLAAGSRRGAKIMTFVDDIAEAGVVLSVLETGPDGVIMTPKTVGDIADLGKLCTPVKPQLELTEFLVTEIQNAGTGDRVCVDTCSNFLEDEGILVGSFGGGFLLACSETHPLPYMPTRPFRVNAGAVSSYVLSSTERTNYLSELRQGHTITGVRVNGETRPIVVGRCKIETRPLLLVKCKAKDGSEASIILQNDWHVRVLGPGGKVLNITELKPGEIVLGYKASRSRHVGMAVDEYCLEQ